MRPPPDAVAQAERWAVDLTSFEYKEQIRAAREMQCLGVAAAPYTKALAGRLEDPRYQIRRACAEVLRMLAEASKDLALLASIEEQNAERAIASNVAIAPTVAVIVPGNEQTSKVPLSQVVDSSSAVAPNDFVPPTAEDITPHNSEQLIPTTSDAEDIAPHNSDQLIPTTSDTENIDPHNSEQLIPTTSETETVGLASEAGEAVINMEQDRSTSGEEDKCFSPEERVENGSDSRSFPHPQEPMDSAITGVADSTKDTVEQAKDVTTGDAENNVSSSEVIETRSDSESIDQQEDLEAVVESEDAIVTTPRTQARADPRAAVLPYIGKLAGAMKDDRWQVRQSAALALAALGGEEVAEYVDNILELLSDEQSEVRCAAAFAIEAVGELAIAHAGAIMSHIDDAIDEVRVQVIKAVASLGKKIEPKLRHVHVLVDLMKTDVAHEVRLAAINALRCQGRKVLPFFPDCLEVVFEDSSRWVRHAALDLLCDWSYESAAQIPPLLKSDDMDVRRRAVQKLGEIAADFCAAESGNRRIEISNRVATKSEEQDKYFAEKREVKRKAKIKRMREGGLELDSDSDVDLSDEETKSEEPLMDEDLEEQANQELDDEVVSHIIALAGFLDDADEGLRTIAANALRSMGAIKSPHTGKLLVVWQDGKWLTKPGAVLPQSEDLTSETAEDS